MKAKEYFGEWLKVIDREELDRVTGTLERLYSVTSISPSKGDVFKAFRICPYNNLQVVMIGQDLN